MTRPRRSAFTLIELILSMAIAAGLAAALYRSMSTVWRAKQIAEAATEPARAGAIALDLIAKDLSSVPPPASSDATTLTLNGSFVGTHQGGATGANGSAGGTDDLYFRTIGRDEPADESDPLCEGVRAIEYLVRNDGPDSVLVRRVTHNVLSTTEQPGEDEVLCRNIRSFTLRYFDGTDWQTDWDSTQLGDVLPAAVEITLDIAIPQASSSEPKVRRTTRIIPLACAKPIPTG